MNITKIKTNRLSVRIGLTLGIEIVLLLSVLVIFIIKQASDDTSKTFGSVTDKIHETDELVKQIQGAMEEQQVGSSQIGQALENMSDSTEEVRKASVEMGTGNEEILLEVQKLKNANNTMNESVRNMGNNTGFITETSENLRTIVDGMKKSIAKIGAQIDNFEV